jgi:hypothetical protein
MTPRIRLIRSLLVGLFLQALTGVTSASANLFLCCRSGPTVAGATSQVPPIQGGLARVWFLRQFEPGESLAAPIISANAAPVGQSLPGTAFLRDFSPGTYTFTVPTQCRASGSTPVRRRPFSSLQGRRPSSRSNHCAAGRAQAATTSRATLSMYGQFRRIGPKNIFPP